MLKDKFRDQIWITRMARINAEKRLLHNESFIQGINIYYSLFTVFISISVLIWPSQGFSVLSLAMTVALLIVILYFKSLRFPERAMDYRRVYTELQKLEFQLSQENVSEDIVNQVTEKYCNLIAEGENHISYDYYKAVANSSEDYKKEHYNWRIGLKYYANLIFRLLICLLVIFFPFILCFLIWWVSQLGWISI